MESFNLRVTTQKNASARKRLAMSQLKGKWPVGSINPDDLSTWPIDWLIIDPLPEAKKLAGVSEDTLKRNHRDKIVRVSRRRIGMRRGHALMLGAKA